MKTLNKFESQIKELTRTEALELRTILSMWVTTTEDIGNSINFDLDYLLDLQDDGHIRLTSATQSAVKSLSKPTLEYLEAAIDLVTQHIRSGVKPTLSRDAMVEALIKDGYTSRDAARAIDSYLRADQKSILWRNIDKKLAPYRN